jgi:DNA-binding winged helix-turn-helix (wHTH) protein
LEAHANGRLRFAEYELDSHWGRLMRNGHPVKIQPQPLRVLSILAQQAGQIVSRKQLRESIRGEATFVEFDQGLVSAFRACWQS